MKRSHTDQPDPDSLTIRPVVDADRAEVESLAGRDTRPVPAMPLLGVEAGGELLVVTSLATGETVADPFRPTAEARAMLELRAAQLRRANGGGRGLRPRLPRRPRATLAGSPPGAGGRLLTLGS